MSGWYLCHVRIAKAWRLANSSRFKLPPPAPVPFTPRSFSCSVAVIMSDDPICWNHPGADNPTGSNTPEKSLPYPKPSLYKPQSFFQHTRFPNKHTLDFRLPEFLKPWITIAQQKKSSTTKTAICNPAIQRSAPVLRKHPTKNQPPAFLVDTTQKIRLKEPRDVLLGHVLVKGPTSGTRSPATAQTRPLSGHGASGLKGVQCIGFIDVIGQSGLAKFDCKIQVDHLPCMLWPGGFFCFGFGVVYGGNKDWGKGPREF